MKLVTFTSDGNGTARLGALTAASEAIVDLQAVQRRVAGGNHTTLSSMQDLIEGGAEGLALARTCLDGALPEEYVGVENLRLLAPLPLPIQIRDCLCFEEHLVGSLDSVRKLTGQEPSESQKAMLNTFRQQPIYYKANRFAVVGPETEVVWPAYSQIMDYELELGMIMGRTGRNICAEEASGYIFGYTVFNDLSARDTQMVEMQGQLGPAKSKDFDGANILGPCIVTADEFDPANARMTVRINGETVSDGNSGDMYYSFADLIAHISRDETLHAGEILGSGTVGQGCGLETGRLLASGDVVELEVEGIGVLRNRIVAATSE